MDCQDDKLFRRVTQGNAEGRHDFLQMLELIQTLTDDGIIVKGIEEGIVDFPALQKNGEEVLLCWKDGEEDIEFWHSLSAGYSGRRPIEEF